jgi:DNA-binding response OmpR family regulator
MKQRILIIDDETDFCLIMKNYFQKRDYDAEVAYSLKEGMAKLNSGKPEILFLDNNLPDGDGWEIVDRIVEIIPQIKIYLVSAHRNESRFIASGYNISIWEKPISLKLLNDLF